MSVSCHEEARFLRERRSQPSWPTRRPRGLPLDCQDANCGASLGMLKAPQVRFCRASDGVRIAYASTGSGPAMIEVATWLNHLEFDWQSPVWRPRLVELAKNYNMTR